MKLRTLIEAILPTLFDELDGYTNYELSLVALHNDTTLAQSFITIKCTDNDYSVISTEVQIISPPEHAP